MIANYHTHSTFCDGKCTPEEMVQAAMAKGMSAIGFSGHGYTEFDLRYCMKDTAGYCREIRRLQEAYKGKIQVYLGIEEDAWHPANRADFDYIIGSCHYYCVDGKYYPIDSNYDYFKKCLVSRFRNPSGKVLLVDIEARPLAGLNGFLCYPPTGAGSPARAMNGGSNSSVWGVADWHNGGTNILWLDGHVSFMREDALYTQGKKAFQRDDGD